MSRSFLHTYTSPLEGMAASTPSSQPQSQSMSNIKAKDQPRVYDIYSWFTKSPTTKLFYIQDVNTANVAISQLRGDALGFDLEWKPNYVKGNPENPVALVQLASQDMILLIHITYMQTFPEKLRELLLDANVVKAGVGIQKDSKKLYMDHNVEMRNCVDLSLLARTVDNNRWKGRYANPIGLARLCEAYEELTLSKGRVQTSNWERCLDQRQQEYAANDCHVGLVLYDKLSAMASSMSSVPQKVWYSFDAICGMFYQPSSGVVWHPLNPYYDPGPPIPPNPPKVEGEQHAGLVFPTFRGGRFRLDRPERPLSPAAMEFVPGAREHSPSPSPSPVPRVISPPNLPSQIPLSIANHVSAPAYAIDSDFPRLLSAPTPFPQPRSMPMYTVDVGFGHQPGRGRGRGRGRYPVAT